MIEVDKLGTEVNLEGVKHGIDIHEVVVVVVALLEGTKVTAMDDILEVEIGAAPTVLVPWSVGVGEDECVADSVGFAPEVRQLWERKHLFCLVL